MNKKNEITTEEQVSPIQEDKKPKILFGKLAGVIAAIVIAITLTIASFVFQDELKTLGGYGYLGTFIVSIIGNATIILPVPSFITAFIGGSLYPPLIIAVVAAAGATIGELTGYLAGTSGKAIIEDRATYVRFKNWIQRYGLVALFVLAAVPNPLFDVAGIIAGMTHIPVYQYLLVTWSGKTIKFLLIAYLGAGSSNLLQQM